MFCPLCQAEYREGFSTCSNCHISLVTTLLEARSKNASLWHGEESRRLDEILSVLDVAKIPCCYKEELSPVPRVNLFRAVPLRPVLKLEVWVLKDDLTRAEAVIKQEELHEDDEE